MKMFWPPEKHDPFLTSHSNSQTMPWAGVCLVAKCSHCLKILSSMEEKMALVPVDRCVKVCNEAAAQAGTSSMAV